MEFYNPNLTVKPATIEGHTGEFANFFLPFYEYGYWFASGQQYTFSAEIPQKPTKILLGITRPDTFQKDCCHCGTTAALL